MREPLDLASSRRFRAAEDELGPALLGKVIGAVHDFVRRYNADSKTVALEYDRIAGRRTSLGQVLEIDVTGKDRLIALWNPPRLTLLDVGGHEVVARYTATMLATDAATAKRVAPGWYPDRTSNGAIFQDSDSRNWQSFAGEDAPDWLYRLAPTQSGVVNSVRKRFARTSLEDPGRYFVVGGPGTGKTSVLLSLLIAFTTANRQVAIRMSDELLAFMSSCGIELGDYRWTPFHELINQPVDLLLVDDPASAVEIQRALNDGYGRARTVVVAFDPSQLETDLTDAAYERLVESNGVTAYRLRDCYRQKESVGRAAKRVIDRVAESSPFLAEAKKAQFAQAHDQVFGISNDLRFVNRGGVTRVWEQASQRTIKEVAAQVQTRRTWRLNATPILIVVDEFTKAFQWNWKGQFGGRGFQVIGLQDLRAVKGLEHQWVVLVLRESLYHELQEGFAGSTQRIYNARRMLRIPFTRARDGILTVVLPDMDRNDIADAFQWA